MSINCQRKKQVISYGKTEVWNPFFLFLCSTPHGRHRGVLDCCWCIDFRHWHLKLCLFIKIQVNMTNLPLYRSSLKLFWEALLGLRCVLLLCWPSHPWVGGSASGGTVSQDWPDFQMWRTWAEKDDFYELTLNMNWSLRQLKMTQLRGSHSVTASVC